MLGRLAVPKTLETNGKSKHEYFGLAPVKLYSQMIYGTFSALRILRAKAHLRNQNPPEHFWQSALPGASKIGPTFGNAPDFLLRDPYSLLVGRCPSTVRPAQTTSSTVLDTPSEPYSDKETPLRRALGRLPWQLGSQVRINQNL